MGVFRLSSWVYNSYGHCCYTRIKFPFETLCVDGNALLHPICSYVFGYSPGESPAVKDATYEERVSHVVDILVYDIERLITKLRVKKVIIAFDGCAPIAKQYQQRCRRFFSSFNEYFDSSFISPGTRFTTLFLKEFGSVVSTKRWILLEPLGEGEHALMRYISRNDLGSVCILGPDGDLIFLALLVERNITLLRFDKFVDVTKMRKELSKKFSIKNLVFLSFLLGNDFLPRLKMFYTLEEGMDVIDLLGVEVIKDGSVNLSMFEELLKRLSFQEREKIQQQAFKLEGEKEDRLLNSFCDSGMLEFEGYRGRYNLTHFETENVSYVCYEYLKTILWVWDYYNGKESNQMQFYPYQHPPLVSDLCENVRKVSVKTSVRRTLKQDRGGYVPVKAQLLLVLPVRAIAQEIPECIPFCKRYSSFYYFEPKKSHEGLFTDYEYRCNVEMPPVSAAVRFVKGL